MTLVAWVLSIAGAGIAAAMCLSNSPAFGRKLDLGPTLAVLPLPTLAVYYAGPDLVAAIRAGEPARALVFPGVPALVGAGTLLMVLSAYHRGQRS
jgi:hypothetical protein